MSHSALEQQKLTDAQLAQFYVDIFVETQVRQFLQFTRGLIPPAKVIVDIGGGSGYFAQAIQVATGARTRVVDLDRRALERCRTLHPSVEAIFGDGVSPVQAGDEGIVCMNLMLHHLVGQTEAATRKLQKAALTSWRGKSEYLFINEYIYESPANISGRLIYEITSSRWLSACARLMSRLVPSFRANTFGVGVRFRANREWQQVFRECGYEVVRNERSHYDRVALPLRLLMIKSISIESYLLRAA